MCYIARVADLVWEGTYRDGKCVAPVRTELPFQTVDTATVGAEDRTRACPCSQSRGPGNV